MKTPDLLPTNELRQLAEDEAERFVLPSRWQQGRKFYEGYAIDPFGSLDADDVVNSRARGNGNELAVGIADVGTFVPPYVDISRFAQRRLWSIYRDQRAVAPMLPAPLSEDKLSLVHNKRRPVILTRMLIDAKGGAGKPRISRAITRAQHLSYEDVEAIFAGKESETKVALGGLVKLAHRLYVARHRGIANGEMALEDEDGNLLSNQGVLSIGRFIVQEAMIAANMSIARFMYERRIPALYRNFHDAEGKFLEGGDLLSWREFLAGLPPAYYSTRPVGHAAFGVPVYMHFTSPLRRFADFVNHANLVAWMEKRPMPYPESLLVKIAGRMAVFEARRRQSARQSSRRAASKKSPNWLVPNSSPYRQASYLLKSLSSDQAGPGVAATALLSAVGSPEAIAEAKQAAAQFIAANIHHARPTVDILVERGLINIRRASEEEAARLGGRFVAETKDGRVLPYAKYSNLPKASLACVELIASLAQVEVEPIIPRSYTLEGGAMQNPYNYLCKLAKKKRIGLNVDRRDNEDGSKFVNIQVTINGITFFRVASGSSFNSAYRQAGGALIKALDLINDPPPVCE